MAVCAAGCVFGSVYMAEFKFKFIYKDIIDCDKLKIKKGDCYIIMLMIV